MRGVGQQYPFKGVYREILIPERLVHTQILDVEPYSRSEALVSVIFEDLAGGTRMTETILHPTKEARDEHLQSGMETSASASFHRLEEIAQDLSSVTHPSSKKARSLSLWAGVSQPRRQDKLFSCQTFCSFRTAERARFHGSLAPVDETPFRFIVENRRPDWNANCLGRAGKSRTAGR